MAKFLILLTVMYSSLIHASFSLPGVNWKELSEDQRAQVWGEYRLILNELEVSAPDKIAIDRISFIGEAYAAGFECFVAGWPSSKGSDGKCATPVKMNPNYAHHLGCGVDQILCNPAVFGEALCVEFKSSTQKNAAFAQCEKKFTQEGRLYSNVLSEVDPDEMQDLITTVHQKCAIHSANYSCQKLRKKLDFIIPNETPVSYKKAQQSLGLLSADKILDSAKSLQREMETDIQSFKSICSDGVSEDERILCKNISLRVKKAESLIPKLMNRVNSLLTPGDCVNCSTHTQTKVLNTAAVPQIPAENLQCTELDKKKRADKCFDDVKCVIMATAMSAPLAVMEAFGKKPDACLSSQNDCLTNVISAIVDSLVSLVTGLWDLLGSAVSWTGEKLSNFWDYVTKVEDKTSDAQHMLNKMSAKEVETVKQNPIEWITSFAGNIWKGLGNWMKEDIFCEKWAGIPRASQCVQPSRGIDCMSCRTMITGTCSIAGVVIAEVLPSVLTGGGASLVSHGAKGAKAFATFIKTSKSYKKVVSVVDKLSDVRAIKLVSQGTKATTKVIKVATKPIAHGTKVSMNAVSSGYKAAVKTKAFQAMSKSMDVAAKYTGISAVNKLHTRLYSKGYDVVDRLMTTKTASRVVVPRMMQRLENLSDTSLRSAPEYKHLYDDLDIAEDLRVKYAALVEEGEEIKKIKNLTPEQLQRNHARVNEMRVLEGQVHTVGNRFTENLLKVLKDNDIPVEMGFGYPRTLVLDFSKPSTNYAVEMYRRVQSRFGMNKISISLTENTLYSTRGFFLPAHKRLEMGYEQALDLLREHFNAVSKHESRHGMFFAKRAKGKDSVFHASFRSSGDDVYLNSERFYHEFMSAEELYTFSTDLQSLAQALKGEYLTDAVKSAEFVKVATKNNRHLNTVASTSKNMSQSMMDAIDEIRKSPQPSKFLDVSTRQEGNWSVKFWDKQGREVDLVFVDPVDKAHVQAAFTMRKDIEAKTKAFLDAKITAAGRNPHGIANDINYGVLKPEDKKLLEDFTAEFFASSEGSALIKNYDELAKPVIDRAYNKMKDLNKLSDHQLAASDKLARELSAYEKSPHQAQLQVIRDQLVKTAKNVKEDYSGFALNTAK